MTKPLFIPLRAEWFEAFLAGTKDTEYRAYGPRWNERTCAIGRRAVLARGYGHPRLDRIVSSFRKITAAQAPQAARDIFPTATHFAAIGLQA